MNSESKGIQAYLHSIDYLFDATFDSQPWFEQAPDYEIKAVIDSGFTGEPAKQIAWFFNQPLSDVELVLNHWRISHVDFIVEIHVKSAVAWIRFERVHLIHLLPEELK